MKRFLTVLVIGGFFLGLGIPATANARDLDIGDGVYWSKEDVDDLLSPQILRSLSLNRRQRDSLEDLLRRDWGRGRDDRYRDLDSLFGGSRLGGGRIVIERDNDNLDTILALLGFGILMNRINDDDYYSRSYIRADDFLYYFFQILDLNQRYKFRIYFDRWYDDHYYRPNRDRYKRRPDDRDWRDWSRELERRLKLSERQRERLERELRDYYDSRRDRDRRYRDAERDYFRQNWERRDQRDFDEHRKRLERLRREENERDLRIRERFRSILDERQRRAFDSLRHDENHREKHDVKPPVKWPPKPKHQGHDH
ncbi:MAG: hypothetical protein ACP5DY_06840 [Thermovirgaceae bacterium]